MALVSGGVLVAGLVLIGLWELTFPFAKPVEGRLRHYARNSALGFVNTVAALIVFGTRFTPLAVAAAAPRMSLFHVWNLPTIPKFVLAVVLIDLGAFLVHVARHFVPWLWRFHRVHHSDLDFDVTTAFRLHTGDVVLTQFFDVVWIALIGPPLVAAAIYLTALNLGMLYQHANIRLPNRLDWLLRLVLVTPNMHRIHHSDVPEFTNSNFSLFFSWWDRMAGYYLPLPIEQITLGIGLRKPAELTLGKVFALPFRPLELGDEAPGEIMPLQSPGTP